MLLLLESSKELHRLIVNSNGNLSFFQKVNYPLLAYNWPTILLWVLFFQQLSEASLYIREYLIKKQSSSSFRERLKWCTHVCSQVHAAVVVYLCYKYLVKNTIDDNVFGFDTQVITLANFSLGYFIWDLITSVIDISHSGVSFVAHALVAINCLLFAYRPAIHSFVPAVLSSEISTIFLNNVWFCDKLGYSGSAFQILNGVALAVVFFAVRVVYGAISFSSLTSGLLANIDSLGNYLVFSTLLCIVVLWPLNLFWMYKIVASFYARTKETQTKPKQS